VYRWANAGIIGNKWAVIHNISRYSVEIRVIIPTYLPSKYQSFMILSGALIISAYLAGSISSAVIVCKIMGLPDPRTQGSGNPGATNVLRVGNKKAAAITLIGDLLKGLIPVLLAKFISDDANVIALVAVAAFLGHLYPIFFGFKGGKGVATAAGVFLGFSLPVGIMVMVTWLLIAKLTNISSVSALIAAALSPVYFTFVQDVEIYTYTAILLAIVLMYRHRSNIHDLLQGKEGKISNKD